MSGRPFIGESSPRCAIFALRRPISAPYSHSTAFCSPFAVGGNWKCNCTQSKTAELVDMLNCSGAVPPNTTVVVAPTSIHLQYVQAHLRSDMVVSSQNVNHVLKLGAYTGEISPIMLADLGVGTALIGHSERRHIYNESLDTIKAKVAVCMEQGLKVILCVGETLEQREAGDTMTVVGEQLTTALEGAAGVSAENVIVAYEPVWAIGTGKTATPELAQEVHAQIRAKLASLLDGEQAGAMPIIYGGSVKGANAKSIGAQPDIDGFLIGGSSLKPDFLACIAASPYAS